MKVKFWGRRTDAMFDWWSFGHAALYFVLAYFWLNQFPLWEAILIYLFLAYVWEVIEQDLEVRLKEHFEGKEHWANRYVGDILAGLAGLLMGWF
jgi:hypothetical protein